ncbi:hypothetical protein I5G49_00005 [Pseudomonas aeruginosa]|uniref:hypothetical protein n=1 Tax=Pseudomonas aeruginosa TaxID=287 RepID=UPI0002C6249A|nr:hypothetical protein [Pseudomonas aeruginosa]AGI81065.1 hypothetical protein G655_10710 [Pseudomonas aeruginosa B136-33]MBG5838918.1 hypothetical protein [Pseudomonas aeruginosa]MBG7300636.1 hypothetical protein [Pseudomonas aeruginosa]NPS95662.1 hypothetical protein [Pseudomonas aeruginosa]RPO37447.1 hypothetical protein IPC1225_28330 [Pseudomonas aeruginosa]
MAGYDKEKIIKEFKESGAKAYSAFHAAKLAEARKNGDDFPALMTFRGWLLDAGLIAEKGKKGAEPTVSGGDTVTVEADYLEFLKAHLPADIKVDPENSFLKWKVKRLEEQLRKLQEQK